MLVLINVVLFGASLSAENIDQNVSSAILYIMFAIAYYVTTSTCLFGANALKRKAYNHSVLADSAANGQHQSLVANKEGKTGEFTIATPGDNFVPPSSNGKSAVGNSKNVSKKQQVSGKRGNDTRKTGPSNSSSSGISSVHLSN